MKKIMFNDKYGLTEAVLEGRKTMTRRIAFSGDVKSPKYGFLTEGTEAGKLALCDKNFIVAKSSYKLGEVVAVAQSYSDIFVKADLSKRKGSLGDLITSAGWDNKMFVQAEVMPEKIRITNVRVERLQDISDEDCLKEGIIEGDAEPKLYGFKNGKHYDSFFSPREAFAALIDKVSGKGTWKSNPWVFVYEFELMN